MQTKEARCPTSSNKGTMCQKRQAHPPARHHMAPLNFRCKAFAGPVQQCMRELVVTSDPITV